MKMDVIMNCEYDCKQNGVCQEPDDDCSAKRFSNIPLNEMVGVTMDEKVRVVEVTLISSGMSFIDEDVESALLSINDSQEDDEYLVKIFYMDRSELDALDEFEGF